jgi:hypothetical protein
MSSPVNHSTELVADLRGAGADHVADVGDQVTLFLQRFDELDRAALAVFSGVMPGRVLQHGQRVQRDVRAGGGVRRRRQVVGVGFARDLEHDGQALRHFRTAGEPLGVGPALQHGLGVGVALVGFSFTSWKGRTSAGSSSGVGGDGADGVIVQQLDQRRML